MPRAICYSWDHACPSYTHVHQCMRVSMSLCTPTRIIQRIISGLRRQLASLYDTNGVRRYAPLRFATRRVLSSSQSDTRWNPITYIRLPLYHVWQHNGAIIWYEHVLLIALTKCKATATQVIMNDSK